MAESMFMDGLVQDSPWKMRTSSYKLQHSNQTVYSKETQPIFNFNRVVKFQKQNSLQYEFNIIRRILKKVLTNQLTLKQREYFKDWGK